MMKQTKFPPEKMGKDLKNTKMFYIGINIDIKIKL